MATQTYEQARAAYESSRADLYAPVTPQEVERGAALPTAAGPERVDNFVNRSQELHDVLSETLTTTSDPDLRDLASLKLLASAAVDLAVANDLFEAGDQPLGMASAEPERGASAVTADPTLRAILDAPLQGSAMRNLQVERGALPTDPKAARSALQDEVNSSVSGIVNAAGDLSVSCVMGAVSFGLGPAQTLASGALSEVLKHLPDAVSIFARAAARVVVEAIRKLWAALGKDVQDKVQDEASGWLKKIWNNGSLVMGLLKDLYSEDALTQELKQAIQNAGDKSKFNDANQGCSDLEARFSQQKTVLECVLRGLNWLKGPLSAAMPWGPIAAYAAFAGSLGYAVYSAGDYIDAERFRSAWLDHVVGVRAIVLTNLIPAENSAAGSNS